MQTILRTFFHLLYHQFAFAYDFVAAVVSFGRWKAWILEVVPFIEGTRILEIGQGPGHLQRFLHNRGLVAVAIDESAPMTRIAKRNLIKHLGLYSGHSQNKPTYPSDYTQTNLTRGLAQQLPFPADVFDTVIATFPAEYITDTQTLSEVNRCLSDGGRFVVLPVAMPKNGFLSWLFRVTGQAPSDSLQVIQEKLKQPFVESNFDVDLQILDKGSGTLIIIVAKKETHAQKTS